MSAALVFLISAGAVLSLASSVKPSVQEVSEGLTCQCGCGLTVANCNHPQCEFSVPVREEIERMIAKGIGRGQIIAAFRTRYGEKILSAPTTQGFNLLAWVIPFVAVFAGCFLIVGAVGRWRSNATADTRAAEPASAEYDSDLRSRLARELEEHR
jgi:cytochrome c-type biogenesis protein CcmH